jgi:hypothetical protein
MNEFIRQWSFLWLGFRYDISNGVHDVNVDTSYKILNNVVLCTLLDVPKLNIDHKMDNIYFI